jgi:hypothetical protein
MIRVFGRRYRQVVRGWEASIRGPDRHADRRYVQLSDTSGFKADGAVQIGQAQLWLRSTLPSDRLWSLRSSSGGWLLFRELRGWGGGSSALGVQMATEPNSDHCLMGSCSYLRSYALVVLPFIYFLSPSWQHVNPGTTYPP